MAFSRMLQQEGGRGALVRVRTPRPPSAAPLLVSRNPATGEILESYAFHSASEIDQRLSAVHLAQTRWARLPLDTRATVLRTLAEQLARESESLARLVVLEMGKPLAEARREIEKCVSVCEHYATETAAYLERPAPLGQPAYTRVTYRPLGTLLAIMPWNFPFWQVFRVVAPALMVGNAVLLKHAPSVTGCALAIEQLFRRAGAPADLLRVVLARASDVPRLIEDERVRAVAFTGSTTVGRRVGALAGEALKPAVLELGGNDAYLVLADADVQHAARTLATARLVNNGQTCISPKRLIVHEAVRAEFEQALAQTFAERCPGDPTDLSYDLGPLAREDVRQRVHDQVCRSVEQGAHLVTGGELHESPGFFYPPTILTAVRSDMPAAQEEVFGPVAVILPASTEEEAVTLANATPYGLGAGVFTRDRERGERIALEQLDVGMACVNDCVRSHLHVPFGGTKASGVGRELGPEGLRALAVVKTLTVR